jgi:hypothetical protein
LNYGLSTVYFVVIKISQFISLTRMDNFRKPNTYYSKNETQ